VASQQFHAVAYNTIAELNPKQPLPESIPRRQSQATVHGTVGAGGQTYFYGTTALNTAEKKARSRIKYE